MSERFKTTGKQPLEFKKQCTPRNLGSEKSKAHWKKAFFTKSEKLQKKKMQKKSLLFQLKI